ncbi:MAG TPA: sigma-70 family RNA polymerase sigma factor [Gemmataceae bacterium]|nr:sigma-70 family RNA polymerase sigma factor [Gemmataceae bacterium]
MGERHEFLKLLLRHETDIKAFIGSLVLDPHLRDDVFQEVALVLWLQFDSYDPHRSFGAWARGIAYRKILELRHQNARFPVVFSPKTIQAVLDAYDRIEAAVSRKAEALRECLKELPDSSRHLLTLRYEDGLAAEEIARQKHSTVNAVYQALSRIRARLEECIRQRLAVE